MGLYAIFSCVIYYHLNLFLMFTFNISNGYGSLAITFMTFSISLSLYFICFNVLNLKSGNIYDSVLSLYNFITKNFKLFIFILVTLIVIGISYKSLLLVSLGLSSLTIGQHIMVVYSL